MISTTPQAREDGDGQREGDFDIPMLGRPLFAVGEDTTRNHAYPPTSAGPFDSGPRSAGMWSNGFTTTSKSSADEDRNISAGSDHASRISKGDTTLVTPVHDANSLSQHAQQNSETSSDIHRPVKSFSLPPWAIETNHSSAQSQPNQLNLTTSPYGQRIPNGVPPGMAEERTEGSDVRSSSRFGPPSESPFTDNAAVDELHKPPHLVLESPKPLQPLEVTFDSPTTDGYFPSTLQIDTSKNGAAGPLSAASDPYTMHQTFATDPIHQNTVPNTPRQLHPRSLSSHLASHPQDSAARAIRKTYPKPNPILRFLRRFKVRHDVIKGMSEQELERFERKEGKKRRRLASWRLAEEDTAEDRIGEDGVERPVVSELFWKVSCRYAHSLSCLGSDALFIIGLHVDYAHVGTGSAVRARCASAHRLDRNHATIDHFPDPRHYAPLPRRDRASSKRSLSRYELLAAIQFRRYHYKGFPGIV